jgi:CDP-diacylglycerol--glycerol-3-phosphate 3-phosphatidyltransferase
MLRIPLLLLAVYILISGNPIAAATLILVVFLMDILDGYVARKFNEVTEFGKVVDEIGDRVVETVLFMTFAYLQYIPLWAPIIMIMRGTIVDSYISYKNPSRKDTVRYNKLIRSDISRGGYGLSKLVLFMGLAMYPILSLFYQNLLFVLMILVILFSIFRGIVKMLEA